MKSEPTLNGSSKQHQSEMIQMLGGTSSLFTYQNYIPPITERYQYSVLHEITNIQKRYLNKKVHVKANYNILQILTNLYSKIHFPGTKDAIGKLMVQ